MGVDDEERNNLLDSVPSYQDAVPSYNQINNQPLYNAPNQQQNMMYQHHNQHSQHYHQQSYQNSHPSYQAIPPPTVVSVVPQVILVGGCPCCRVGVLEDDYSCLGICCAILFFPLGVLCCLATKQRRCSNCGAVYG